MPALHEGSRLTGPKHQLRELATRDCYMSVLAICGAKVNIKNETANTKAAFFSQNYSGALCFSLFFHYLCSPKALSRLCRRRF